MLVVDAIVEMLFDECHEFFCLLCFSEESLEKRGDDDIGGSDICADSKMCVLMYAVSILLSTKLSGDYVHFAIDGGNFFFLCE